MTRPERGFGDPEEAARRPALAGLKVVELSHVIAGPMAGSMLGDLGATVIHVEAPKVGDPARAMGPTKAGVPLWWKVAGRNKRSVTLDLRRAEGQEMARRLCAQADVVIASFRPTTLERWRLDWRSLQADNPRLIYLQISAYGATGPHRSSPGFGKAAEARSGAVYVTGFPDSAPIHAGFPQGDTVTGIMGAYAIMAALTRRERDASFAGEWIDLALFESLFRLIEWQVVVYDQLGLTPERWGNRLAISPGAVINTYLTADDDWIVVTSATPKSVQSIARFVGLPTAEFATPEQQRLGADRLDQALAAWMRSREARVCLEDLAGAEIVASRVYNARDIIEDPIYRERQDVISVDDEELGAIRMQGVIPKLANHPGRVWRAGPRLGTDNHRVYREWLGAADADLARWEREGLI